MTGAKTIEVFADGVAIGPASLQGGVHIGHLALNELKLTDRLTELFAIVTIGNDLVHDCLHDAQGTSG